MKLHFGHSDKNHLDKKAEYQQAQVERENDGDEEKNGSAQEEEEEEEDATGDKNVNYNVGKSVQVDPDHSWFYAGKNDYEKIKALSEQQVAELVKKPGNCKHYEKDGMVCATCEDPETGDNSESCAYSSLPNDKKVAYLTKKSSNFKKPFKPQIVKEPSTEAEGEGEDEEEEEGEAEAEGEGDGEAEADEEEEEETPAKSAPAALKVKPEKSESEDADYGAYKLAGSNQDVEDYDEPKFANLKQAPEQQRKGKDFEIIPDSNFEAKSLNQALSDFKTKDWSRCSKIMKGDMTCYYCKDAKNAVQEECMFISASNPKKFKVQRSESKNYDNHKKPAATTKKPPTFNRRPIVVAPARAEALTMDPEFEKKERFARLRIGRPLSPTKASTKATAEPLVTPSNLNPINHDDFQNTANKRTIKRTVSYQMKLKDNDPFIPDETRAVHFETHVRHFD